MGDVNTRPIRLPAMIGAVAGGIAVILGAITPLYLGILDRADAMEQKAVLSHEQAEKSEEKIDIAYELLRREVTLLRHEVLGLKENDRKLRDFLLEKALSGHFHDAAATRRASRGATRGLGGVSGTDPNKDDPLGGLKLEGLEAHPKDSEGGGAGNGEMSVGAQEQRVDLPQNLEAKWREQKALQPRAKVQK